MISFNIFHAAYYLLFSTIASAEISKKVTMIFLFTFYNIVFEGCFIPTLNYFTSA